MKSFVRHNYLFLVIAGFVLRGQTSRNALNFKWQSENTKADANSRRRVDFDEQVRDLSLSEQAQIRGLIHPDFSGLDTSAEDERKIVLNMDAGEISLSAGRKKALFVQPSESSWFCGATGNCSIWLFVRDSGHLRQVLSDSASWAVIEKTRTRGMHDITMRTSLSSSQSGYASYQWNGVEYKQTDFRIVDLDDPKSGK